MARFRLSVVGVTAAAVVLSTLGAIVQEAARPEHPSLPQQVAEATHEQTLSGLEEVNGRDCIGELEGQPWFQDLTPSQQTEWHGMCLNGEVSQD